MSGKSTLAWYERKSSPMNERRYDGDMAGQLFFKAKPRAPSGKCVCMKCEAEVNEAGECLALEWPRCAPERIMEPWNLFLVGIGQVEIKDV